MNRKNRRRNVQQPHGCLGRMVNLFDFGTVSTGKKLLTVKPFSDNGSLKRNQLNLIEDKVDVIGVNGTPMKKLLEEEMSKELELTGSTNLVAKLMGLDSFPHANSSKPRLKRSFSHGECRDVYEILDVESLSNNEKKMETVREKFLEAKRLVTDEKLRHSKEFQEAMEVLSSNKELFLEFLQDLSHHHLHSFPEKSKRITILKPSKPIDEEAAATDSLGDGTKSVDLFKRPVEEDYPKKQSTRIVVLKPTGLVTKASSCPTSPRGLVEDGFEERKAKGVVRRVKREVFKDETSHSSVFSNGYTVDDSYDADSEIMSPVSRHSWDYINKCDSAFSSSSPFSRASVSPESSSVCREAKKRLSERWALMAAASNESLQEDARVVEKRGGCISLGEMLALSDRTEEANDCNEEHDPGVSASCLPSREEGNFKGLMRSKSLPESSSTSFGNNKGKSKVPELTKSKSLKWSLKGRVSNFLFSRNKKATAERSHEESLDSRFKDESVSARSILSQEAGLSTCFPASVLETSSDDDDEIFFNSSVLNRSSSSLEPEMMGSNLIGKSPSIGRNFSFNDSRCYSSKRSTTSTRDEEEDMRLLINTLLSAAHLDEEPESSLSPSSIIDYLLSKWHSVESPLDPSLRESYADSTQHQRLGSNVKKLVFDLVNTLLLELTPSYLGHGSSHMLLLSGKTLRGYVMNRMQECLKGNGRVEYRWWDEDGDLSSLAVNRVVRTEVAEIGSRESLRLEMECMGEEIELKLLEELVEEVLLDFSEQTKLFIRSIC
ncbi:Methyl-coenzyme M reductase II subunit gamma [Hirschfeldia incana]|nr:Methyl-coenzyme M reductase II subunit gamma [Hirschfeldia incana]KAJ0252580.1 Methyl-coenzyme M reductase II subunit gamma [Hirschfeldia incana]